MTLTGHRRICHDTFLLFILCVIVIPMCAEPMLYQSQKLERKWLFSKSMTRKCKIVLLTSGWVIPAWRLSQISVLRKYKIYFYFYSSHAFLRDTVDKLVLEMASIKSYKMEAGCIKKCLGIVFSDDWKKWITVSYTHLTLPTICSV